MFDFTKTIKASTPFVIVIVHHMGINTAHTALIVDISQIESSPQI